MQYFIYYFSNYTILYIYILKNLTLWAWQWKRARGVAAASVWGRECCLSQATAMKEEL
jgi:hypothetical protein